MRVLLDTQLIFWWLADPERLPRHARETVERATHAYVSHASLWEMAIKVSIGKMAVDIDRFEQQVTRDGFAWLPIERPHLLAVASLEAFEDHRDPFDRLLVAQSRLEPLILLTTDGKLARYGATVRVL